MAIVVIMTIPYVERLLMNLSKAIEKSFPKIEKLFSQEWLSEFCQTPYVNLEKYNFDPGTMIRLKLLRHRSYLRKAFIQSGYVDTDEMAMKVIRQFHQHRSEERL